MPNFDPHIPLIINPIVLQGHEHARTNSSAEDAARDRQLVAQNAGCDEFKEMLGDFLPTLGATGLGLVARARETQLADREVRVALDGGAFEGEGLVEVKDAAQEHGLRAAFEAVVGAGAVVMAWAGRRGVFV
jgi:hypothetical protein